MRMLSPHVLDHLLRDPSGRGLHELVAMQVTEHDALDFKVAWSLHAKDRKAQRELRADCAALASVGVGYLVIGIDESRDGRNTASRIVGVPILEAASVKCSIEDLLGEGLSPPIIQREVWVVDVDPRRSVVVAKVSGRPGYPVAVVEKLKNSDGTEREASTYYVREAGKKKALTTIDADARRERLDHARERRRQKVLAVAAGVSLVLAALGLIWAWSSSSESRELAEQIGALRAAAVAQKSETLKAETRSIALEEEVEALRTAARGRVVNVEQLANAMKVVNGWKLRLQTSAGDEEAFSLACQLRDAASAAGTWDSGEVNVALYVDRVYPGLVVTAAGKPEERVPPAVEAFVLGLKAQGVEFVLLPNPELPPDELHVLVGPKPRGETVTPGLSAR